MGSLIDKDKLKAKAIEVIGKNKLIFIEDICAMCGVYSNSEMAVTPTYSLKNVL